MTVIRSGVMWVGWAIAAIALAACGGGDASPTPTPTATVVASPTVTPTEPPATATPSPEELEAEVSAAYLAYWDAYAEALLKRDASLVETFAVGVELQAIRDEIEQLRSDGWAVRIVVEHNFEIASLDETDAIVIDEYLNNSYLVNPETLEGDEQAGPNEVIRDIFLLERIDGRWIVVQGGREASD
ncbi:MAG: hypothetical protein AB7I38_15485 [Dehalococcoidia bacterium]